MALPWRSRSSNEISEAGPRHGLDEVGESPWTPSQIFAAAFLFGPLAGGIVSALNFSRMGQSGWAIPSILLGVVLFAAVLGLVFFAPDSIALARPLVWLAVGGAFMALQQASFHDWQVSRWGPDGPKEGQMPSASILPMVLIGLACLAVQVGVAVLVFLAVG